MSNVIDWPKQEDDDGTGRREVPLFAGCENETCEIIEKAMLKRELPVYVNAGRLVTAISGDSLDYDPNQEARSVRLIEVEKPRLMWHMGEACYFQKWDSRKKDFVGANTPENLALLILGRVGLWPFPEVIGVMSAQSIDARGNIIDQEGVHRASGLLFVGLPKLPPIPDRPTRADALAALGRLKELLKEFPFVDPDDKEKKGQSLSVAIATLIAPLCSALCPNTPMTIIDAPAAGSGKSYFCKLVAAILTGRAPANVPRTDNAEEFEKRLVGVLLQCSPLISLDNINGTLKSDLLCQAITEPELEIRPLGTSTLARTRVRSSILANGNGITVADDLVRRSIKLFLDHNEERPEEHEYKLHPRPLERIMADRGRFIADALIIVKAYIVAGRPDRKPQLASFEEWSDNVRSALVWLGLPDPCGSTEEIRDADPTSQKLQALVDAWPQVGTEYTIKELVKEATVGTDLSDVLLDIAPAKNGVDIDKTRLGLWIKSKANNKVRTRNKIKVKLIIAGKDRTNKVTWKLQKLHEEPEPTA